jgi:hypothetical protein
MSHPDDDRVEVLRVPSQAQPESEPECLPYSMWIILHYVAEWHPVPWVRDETQKLSIADIEARLTIRDAGWIPDDDELESLSEKTAPIRFRHETWESSPPTTVFFDMIEDKLEKNLPVIPIIDVRALKDSIPNQGPVHAVVVTGLEGTSITINDPWGRMHEIHNKNEFVDAWDARPINQMVIADISEQSTIQQSLTQEDQE